jgi:hypothetical protein
MKPFHTVTLLAALSMIGCGYTDYGPVRLFEVDEVFSDSQMNIMQKEADILCEVTEGAHCYEMTRKNSPHDIGENDRIVWKNSTVARAVQEVHTNEANVYYQFADISDERLHLSIRHEFGHIAGCWTHLPTGNVMAAWLDNKVPTWTALDLQCIRDNIIDN